MKFFVFFVFFLAVWINAFAYVSSQEALAFVNENGYLFKGEEAIIEFNSKFVSDEKSYWLVSINSGDTLSGFIAVVDSKNLAVVSDRQLNSELFEAIDVLSQLKSVRNRFAEQKNWVFSKSNSSFLSDLSRFLKNESIQLDSIKNDVNETMILVQLDSMKSELNILSSLADSASKDISDAVDLESDVFLNPSFSGARELESGFEKAFKDIDSLKQKAIGYDAGSQKLKSLISNADILIDQKSTLIELASPPRELYNITSIASSSALNQQSVQQAFKQSSSRVSEFVENLSMRIEKAKAFAALYRQDSLFFSKTKKYNSLKEAYDAMVLNSDKTSWKNQTALNSFEKNYNDAKSGFEKNRFKEALKFAGKAKSSAIEVLSSGLKEETAVENETDLTPIIQAILMAFIAIIALIIVFKLLKKRGESN